MRVVCDIILGAVFMPLVGIMLVFAAPASDVSSFIVVAFWGGDCHVVVGLFGSHRSGFNTLADSII